MSAHGESQDNLAEKDRVKDDGEGESEGKGWARHQGQLVLPG